MQTLRALFTICCLSLLVTAQDPTKTLPDAYQQVFANEYVQVQRVHYAPRVKLPEHDHTAWPVAYVYLNDAGPVVYKHIGLSYGAVTRPAVKAGSYRLYRAVKETHTVESLSDTPSDFLRVEFKTDIGHDHQKLGGKYFRLDVPANAHLQQVQFENEQVRVTRALCATGKPCAFAAQVNQPALLVALTAVQSKSLKLALGQTLWLAVGKSESLVNTGKETAELLRFDFKTVPRKATDAEEAHAHKAEHALTPELAERQAQAAERLKRGTALEAVGKINEAIAEHEEALKLRPDYLQAQVNLISLYGRADQPAKAEQQYRNALAINPEIPELHFNYGVLLFGLNRPAEAAQAFLRCLQFNPAYAEAHFNYASIIERDGKLDEAAAHYRKALASNPRFRSAHFQLGRILVNQGKLTEGIAEFEQTLKPEDANTPRFLYALGATWGRAGDKLKSIQYMREALKMATALNQTELIAQLERDLKTLEAQQ